MPAGTLFSAHASSLSCSCNFTFPDHASSSFLHEQNYHLCPQELSSLLMQAHKVFCFCVKLIKKYKNCFANHHNSTIEQKKRPVKRFIHLRAPLIIIENYLFSYDFTAAWAAARSAIGTLYGEH